MRKEKTQTKFEMVKEFYNLINNSYEFDVYDEAHIHRVYNSTLNEKKRYYSDMDGRSVEIFVDLSDDYRYTAPHNQIKRMYNEKDLDCKSDECPLFDFINIYAKELGKNADKAIKNIKFKILVCDSVEERSLMDSTTKNGKEIYETLLIYMKNLKSYILDFFAIVHL